MGRLIDREKVIKALEYCVLSDDCRPCEYRMEFDVTGCQIMKDALALLKEQEAVQQKIIPEELKQKMWNALYAEEDKIEEMCLGTSEHENWFFIYRPWLQKGFNIAIKAIADWEGR